MLMVGLDQISTHPASDNHEKELTRNLLAVYSSSPKELVERIDIDRASGLRSDLYLGTQSSR